MIIPLFSIGQQGKSSTVTAQSHTNVYAEISVDADKSNIAFYGTPGLVLFADFGDTPHRGAIAVGDFIYTVHRGTFWELNNAGVRVNRGSLNTTSGRVQMTYNGPQIEIVDGVNAYCYTIATNAFQVIASALFANPIDATFQDGYGINCFLNSGQFQISSSYGFLTYDGLEFATAESNPDGLVRVIADHGELVLFGTGTTEFWGNSGQLDFPYTNLRGTTIEYGLAARLSVTKYNDSLIGLFKNPMGQVNVLQLVGHSVRRVSTDEIDYIINNYDSVADATGYAYMLGGHPMYQINFPTEGKSWLYDGASGLWTILESGLNGGRHRGEFLVDYLNKPRIFDYENGRIYTMDADAYTDNGTPIKRQLRAKHFFKDFKRVTVQRLNLDFETGVGLISGQGEDPQVMLRVSRDNGHTWGAELWRSIGKIGKYLTRVFWTRLGSSRDFVFEITVTDSVKFALPAASIEAEVTQ